MDANQRMWTAVQKADEPTLRSALASGAWVNAKDVSGDTALMMAAGRGLAQCMALLLEVGAWLDP